ncbi:MAG: methionyl-tRNA formyltransferase [Patescibacteria group bacterium]
MKKLSIVFVGTGEFGVKTLNSLVNNLSIQIPLVITGVDKPAGRKLQVTTSAVKRAAAANKLVTQQADEIESLKQKIIQAKPDFLLVVSYGEIIQSDILAIPKYGAVNIHGSLLPKYRGASPIHETLLNGDKVAGVTWISMDEHMDSGDIIAKKQISVSSDDDFGILHYKLADLASEHTADILLDYVKSLYKEAQDETQATYCRKIKKEDGLIDFKRETADQIVRKIKAYIAWPGCFFFLNSKRIKILEVRKAEQEIGSMEISAINGTNLLIGTHSGTLELLKLQPESKKPMTAVEFLRGQRNLPNKLT